MGPRSILLLGVLALACFPQPDLDNIKCSTPDCPPGYVCVSPPKGRCVRIGDSGVADGSVPEDAPTLSSDVGQIELARAADWLDVAQSDGPRAIEVTALDVPLDLPSAFDAEVSDVPMSGGGGAGGGAGTGGVVSSGGALGLDGPAGAGGAGGSDGGAGGIAANGGSMGHGGTGGSGSGGVVSTGGVGTGGVQGTGGTSPGSGGTGGTGATVSSGGTTATGGTVGSGGTSSTGGIIGTGGTPGTGGVVGTGGAIVCPSPALAPGDTTVTMTVGGQSRAYILHVPSAYQGNTPVPLILDFHPIQGSDTGEEGASPFKAVTDPEGVITAYPQGLPGSMGAAWNVGPCCVASVDDVAFAKAIVADVESKACIDTKRIYAVGFSLGGGMSHYIACKAADVFAAVAPAAFDLLKGSLPEGNADDCDPARPIPVVSFRGTADTVAIYAGGLSTMVSGMPMTFLGARACWEKWASINKCTDTPIYPTASGSAFQCSYYRQCDGNVQVGVCINTGAHAYGDGTIGWNFLKQFTLP